MTIQLRSAALIPFAVAALALAWAPAAVSDEPSKSEKVSVLGKATLEVPGRFERTQPASRIVEDEFVAKLGEGEDAKTARLYMMASGGSLDANLERWKGQFSGDAQAFKTKEMKRGNWNVVVAEHSGTYTERMGGGPFAPGRTVQRPDYGMVGAIIIAPDPANADADPNLRPKYFVKMVGPQGVIDANKEAFLGMVKSLKE